MSAINLYATKQEALYFKDSQRNSFYEFGGIQLIPSIEYFQKITIPITSIISVNAYKVIDDSFKYDLTSNISLYTSPLSINYLWLSNLPDLSNDLIYLKFKINPISTSIISNFKQRVLLDGGTFEAEAQLQSYLLTLLDSNDFSYFYSTPFYITSLDEDRTTYIEYYDNYNEYITEANPYQSIQLKFWFRQKSRQSELTTYYEASTKNTVTQAIKTHSLEMYESEFMSIEDLIMTAEILEKPYLFIDNKRCSLFEAVKIPELTQQENFGKIKFTLAPNN